MLQRLNPFVRAGVFMNCFLALMSMHAGQWVERGWAQAPSASVSNVSDIPLQLARQDEVDAGTGRFHRISESVSWKADQVAVIVCDVWDSHHCLNAVRRVGEVAPRIDSFVAEMRRRGATIIHAPSDCMPQYKVEPARLHAQAIPIDPATPDTLGKWCDRIPSEEQSLYPVDQSDGGEDDDLVEHAQWHETLRDHGRNPKTPWLRQTEQIRVDQEQDFISDSGKEIWNILKSRNVKHVMLCGVHTNMCVLGRPFGLRQLKAHGIEAVLVRDLTDTMYNPQRWPFVSHFSGTDAVVQHIERFVCSTMTSDQVLGGIPFRFSEDHRPHWAILIAEDEYKTEETLVRWANEHLAKDFRFTIIYSDAKQPNRLIGLEALAEADALLVSVRRRPLPAEDLERIRSFVAAGKPVLGIRTASHAFSLRDKLSPGLEQWPEFDSQVFGGNYTNHYGNEFVTTLEVDPKSDHELVPSKARGQKLFQSKGSLYRVTPLQPGTKVLWLGSIPDQPAEPVAWTFVRRDSGKSFYTSLGHAGDFEEDSFNALLLNAAYWLTDLPNRVTPQDIGLQQFRHRSGQGKQR
ncbi:MAG: ThuA domain-containing protein [Planctomycetota bacterium]